MSARSDAEFVPQLSYNGNDGACHDPERGETKVYRNTDEAADGRLDLSDAELVQNFSTSEAMPLIHLRDRRRDQDVPSPDLRPGTNYSQAVCTDIHVTNWARSLL